MLVTGISDSDVEPVLQVGSALVCSKSLVSIAAGLDMHLTQHLSVPMSLVSIAAGFDLHITRPLNASRFSTAFEVMASCS